MKASSIDVVPAPHAGAYHITQDWFTNHIPAWERILKLVKPTRVLEIGSYEGLSTTYIITECSAFGPLELCCVDTWAGAADLTAEMMSGVEERFDANVASAIARAPGQIRLQKVKQRSSLALATLIANETLPFDLIYVDGSHTAADVMTDAVLAFHLLRIGGVMIFDDYLWSMEPALYVDPLNMPKPAIDSFSGIFMRKVRVLPDLPNAQCYLEKISD